MTKATVTEPLKFSANGEFSSIGETDDMKCIASDWDVSTTAAARVKELEQQVAALVQSCKAGDVVISNLTARAEKAERDLVDAERDRNELRSTLANIRQAIDAALVMIRP